MSREEVEMTPSQRSNDREMTKPIRVAMVELVFIGGNSTGC
jgi:hypothetical protein